MAIVFIHITSAHLHWFPTPTLIIFNNIHFLISTNCHTFMGSRARWKQRWCTQTLTPLLEGPDPDMQEEGNRKESSWEIIREWFRLQRGLSAGNNFTVSLYGSIPAKRQDLRLLLGVLGCPLAPIPLVNDPIHRIHIKNTPIVSCCTPTYLIFSSIFLSCNSIC